jgi:DNA (cytosine-5)-methyltransferase 1
MDKQNLKYIDLCAGTGAFSYCLNKFNAKCVLSNDLEKSSKEIYTLNFPDHNYILDDIHNLDNIPDHNILCAGFPCFIKDTKILTNEGYINIQDVTLNHTLMTHTGKFQKILNLQTKIYNDKNLYNINIKYHPYNVKCTPEHPFYIRQKHIKWNNNLKKNITYFDEPKWIPAKDINNTTYMGMKINTNNIIPEFSYERKINKNIFKTFTIKLDNNDIWFMMGYFIGDGWIQDNKKKDGRSMNKIFFTINNKQIPDILPKLEKIFKLTLIKNSGINCTKFTCSNFVWWNILNKFGRYAHGKKIPEWVQDAPIEYIESFIEGYKSADGCKLNSYTTVSLNLAYGLQRLFMKCGYLFGINKCIRPEKTVIEGRVVNQRNTYKIYGTYKHHKYHNFIEDGYAWFKPEVEIINLTESIPVYNFEVENDNSYIVENIIAHNCQPFSVAGQQKGFNDKRSNVFYKIIEILKDKQPDIFILENVKNLISHDNKKTFKIILDLLNEQNYYVKYKILDTSKITDIPHHRERIYIIGFKSKTYYDLFNFESIHNINELKPINNYLENNIDDKYYYDNRYKVYDEIKKNMTKHINDNVIYQYRRFYIRESKNKCCPTLTANMGTGGHNVPLLLDDKGIRKLTPRECFNLQGFPNEYKLPNLSDSALYKLAGNAVSIPVVEIILKKIYAII